MILIDVFNLLHAWRRSWGASMALRDLGVMLAHGPWGGREQVLACDGAACVDGPWGDLYDLVRPARDARLIFAGPSRCADTLLERLVSELPRPQDALVVSSDRAVRQSARHHLAKAIGSTEFLRDVHASWQRRAVRDAWMAAESAAALPPGSVSHWLSYFGIDAQARSVRREGESSAGVQHAGGGMRAQAPSSAGNSGSARAVDGTSHALADALRAFEHSMLGKDETWTMEDVLALRPMRPEDRELEQPGPTSGPASARRSSRPGGPRSSRGQL